MDTRIGRYEVLDHLASGGMGHVYLARATGVGGFERKVVIKTLDPGGVYSDDDALVTMFLDEARLVGALHHQYIAPVHEVGCDEEGRYFLVMDYINGETAEAIWKTSDKRGIPVPLALSLAIGSAVASALDYAHNLKAPDGTPLDIVHRDVSLSNIMVGTDGSVKLIDFGIAKYAQRETHTQVGTLKGKIGYLAPEQVLHRPVDRRTDVFALGIVLYELTTTKRAFRDPSDLITFERITTGELTPPSHIVSGFPPELERILMKALAIDPDDRYQDASALGRDLEALGTKLGLSLTHSAVMDAMATLFNGRRRMARGSTESTPITPVPDHPTTSNTAITVAQAVPKTIHEQPTMPLELPDEDATQPVDPLEALGLLDGVAPAEPPEPLWTAPQPEPPVRISFRRISTTDEVPLISSEPAKWWLWIALVALGLSLGAALTIALI